MMMDSETSKSENNSTPRREFPDHPPILNEDGLVIDCVLQDYPDPPKGTVKTIMYQNGDLIDFVDVHERSLQLGYDVSFQPVPLPLNSWKAPGAFVPPNHKPKATQPVLRHRKNFKPGLLCPWKTQNPPYEHVPPELHYRPVPPDTVQYSPDTVVKDSDDKIVIDWLVIDCKGDVETIMDEHAPDPSLQKTSNPSFDDIPPELHYSPLDIPPPERHYSPLDPDTAPYNPVAPYTAPCSRCPVTKVSGGKMKAMLEKMMAMLERTGVNATTSSDMDFEVNKCLAVIQSMVDDGFIEDCSPLWCYAVSLIKSHISRSIMVNLSTNLKRNAWLRAEFAQTNGVVS